MTCILLLSLLSKVVIKGSRSSPHFTHGRKSKHKRHKKGSRQNISLGYCPILENVLCKGGHSYYTSGMEVVIQSLNMVW